MTTGGTAEEAMRATCDAILRGDMMGALQELTPEALNQAMTMAAETMALPTPESYEVESHEEAADGEHHFRVRFKTSSQDIVATANWRQIDGVWKITAIAAEGLHA
jgi:hypothetical protein